MDQNTALIIALLCLWQIGKQEEALSQRWTLIEECLKKSKCNLPLEKLLDLFTKIDKRYTLYIELSQEKENSHSSVYVPYIFVCYGAKIKDETFPCVIKDGKLNISKDNKYHENEYECALYYYDTDYKDALFELYMNIIKRLK